MPLNVNVSGTWRPVTKVLVRVAGSWLTAKELFAYAAGGWKSSWKNEITYINTSNRTGASIHELMGSPTQPGTYIFENQATISAGTGSYALRTGTFPAGSTLRIVNKGYIYGKGGAGGNYDSAGAAGASALHIDFPCTVDNAAGYIFGGGGGGGGAQLTWVGYYLRAGGGGGAGSNGGSAVNSTQYSSYTINAHAQTGTASAGGVGGQVSGTTIYAQGGSGGGPGSGGTAGVANKGSSSFTPASYVGGAAGAALVKNGHSVTITAGNDTTRIKGAIV